MDLVSGAGGRGTQMGKTAVPMHDNRIASVGALKPVIRRHPPGGRTTIGELARPDPVVLSRLFSL